MKVLYNSLRKILKKNRFIFIILISILSSCIFLIRYTNVPRTIKFSELGRNPKSAVITNTTWLKNPSFNSTIEYWTPSFIGDRSDVNASIHSGQANYEILGDKRTFSLIADPPLASDWVELDNPDFPNRPDLDEITADGCRVSHEFEDQTAVQNPSVHWDHNISLSFNISDYIITSASVEAIINATVDKNLDRLEDYLTGNYARVDPDYDVDTYGVGDYIRFYVLISDLEKNKTYEIAYFQTEEIGTGSPPGTDYLFDRHMISVPEEDLIYYLSSVLSADYCNFTLTLGIKLFIEDNVVEYYDRDTFNELIIKYLNLTFTYEKKINQFTSISWNQNVNPINRDNIIIFNRTLNFKYKVDLNWSESLSPNSELSILINNNKLEKQIKLKDFATTFQYLSLENDDIKSYILPNNNLSLSIMIELADEFALDQIITFSIDDVILRISYTIETEENLPYIFIWGILIFLIIIIAILSSLSLRSYILIPRKLKKRTALLSRTQKFKDADNIQGVLLIHNPSGLPLFSKNYSDLMEGNKTLFSGFLQAISVVGEKIIRKDYVKSRGFQSNLGDGIYNIRELDFKHFHCLMSDIEELRTVLILNDKASKRIKRQLLNFGLSVYAKYSEILKDWNHDVNPFKEEIPAFLDNFFSLDYKRFYKFMINKSDIENIRKELKSSRIDYRILNEILSISEENRIFKLMSLLSRMSSKNEDLVIDTIEILIQKKLLIPADSVDIQI